MKIYDTLTAQKREFVPLGDPVKVYVCGLTPKNQPHLGHAKLFVSADMWRRYLEHKGYQVRYVQNVTDVDDKIIARAAIEGITPAQVAKKYSDAYFAAVDALNCAPASAYPRATEAIPHIIDVTQSLIAHGHAYEVDGNIFYRVASFPTYGRLSKRTQDDNLVGAGLAARNRPVDAAGQPIDSLTQAVDEEAIDTGEPSRGKEDPRDFALWKRAKLGEPSWESPWGPGRPGWHIECSTMILDELGPQIDIHGGGQDLIFPHHENEIAQSEAYTGEQPFVGYWLHIGALLTGNEKMSHSLGNFITIESVLQRFDPMAVRLYLLSQHYRTPVSFTEDALSDAAQNWERLNTAFRNLDLLDSWDAVRALAPADVMEVELHNRASRDLYKQITTSRAAFDAGMDDDFNTAQALAALYGLARQVNVLKDTLTDPKLVNPSIIMVINQSRQALTAMMGILGLRLPVSDVGQSGGDDALAAEVEELLDLRREYRQVKNWAGADEVRARLDALGVIVEDHAMGTIWRRRA